MKRRARKCQRLPIKKEGRSKITPLTKESMESLTALSHFFNAIAGDPRISITHIGLYAALLQYWSEHGFENPIHVFSYEIMGIAKVSSAITYHKCVKELSEYGYIRYEPSFNRIRGSRIYFIVNE